MPRPRTMWRPRDGLRAGPGVKRRNDSARSTAGDQNGSDTRCSNRGRSSRCSARAGGSESDILKYRTVLIRTMLAPAPDGTVFGIRRKIRVRSRSSIRRPAKSHTYRSGLVPTPHGVIVGPDRAAWITEGGQNAIARFDPSSKVVKLFPLPRESSPAPISIPRRSIEKAYFGSPAKTVSTAGLIRRLAK